MTNEEHDDDFEEAAAHVASGTATRAPKPLTALRLFCLWCTNGSADQVKHCPATSCPMWPYRFRRNPTADMLAEIANVKVYPLEKDMTSAGFFENGGKRLNAIELKCLDCSGYCKSEVKNCKFVTCPLYPFRRGTNPNRAMSPVQREAAAARLKDNIEKSKRKDR